MSGRLQNRVCLITGSTGIGAATARLAASEGASVFVVSRDEESCRALAGEIGCGYHVADLTRSGEVSEAVESCLARRDRIDALFNVAGVSGRKFGENRIIKREMEGAKHFLDMSDGWLTTYSCQTVKAGKPVTFLMVLVPHPPEVTGKMLADNLSTNVKDGVTTVSLKYKGQTLKMEMGKDNKSWNVLRQ